MISCRLETVSGTFSHRLICEMSRVDRPSIEATIEGNDAFGWQLRVLTVRNVEGRSQFFELLHALLAKGSTLGCEWVSIDLEKMPDWMAKAVEEAGFSRIPWGEDPRPRRRTRLLRRCGIGYDVHPVVDWRKLVLAGVEIESRVGLLGHSDADVITHAVIDAVLGAVGMGDIGTHFPETDEFKDAKSLELLSRLAEMLTDKGVFVEHVDVVLVMEGVRLSPFREQMEENLKEVLNAPVSVKFKSGNGVRGREDAEAFAIAEVSFLGEVP